MRFALVRYQPGTVTKPTDTVDRRASSVVLTDFVQLARGRTLEASRVDPTTVTVTLSPQNAERLTTATARFQRRVFDPQASGAAAPDVYMDVLTSMTTLQTIPGFSNRTGQVKGHIDATAFRAGRIVVEEHQEGYLVAGVEATDTRVVYRDIIECTVFDQPNGPIL